MWPFDKLLTNKIKDLESTVESLIGQNRVLERELEINRSERRELLTKLLDSNGINQIPSLKPSPLINRPIQVGNRKRPWSETREELELKAKEAYWKKKKQEEEAKISNLENEVLGQEESDASEVS